MLKVTACTFCGKYFRTGKTRRLIIKAPDKTEQKVPICKSCYKILLSGEGLESKVYSEATV